VIGTRNHRRWEISLKDDEDPERASEPDATWALLSRWLTPEDGTLWRQASYRFHALVAERWRSGRVFIAGDAAHQQPPFLGQGMCQGVRDVANLTWKLAEVLRGDIPGAAAEALLDSYGRERKAHVITLTTRLKGIGALICERDRERALARDRRLRADAGGTAQATPRQDVLPRLDGGLLASADTSARGCLCPQPWLWQDGEQVRMDSVLGNGWRLIIAAGADLSGAAQAQTQTLALRTLRLGDTPGSVAEADGVMTNWFQTHQCQAALVRPDHYVFGTAHDADSLRTLLSEAASALR
jgi:3-(3-hydroxy-phenyl)propionate hydroxylase